jgi:hypothetical protein
MLGRWPLPNSLTNILAGSKLDDNILRLQSPGHSSGLNTFDRSVQLRTFLASDPGRCSPFISLVIPRLLDPVRF